MFFRVYNQKLNCYIPYFVQQGESNNVHAVSPGRKTDCKNWIGFANKTESKAESNLSIRGFYFKRFDNSRVKACWITNVFSDWTSGASLGQKAASIVHLKIATGILGTEQRTIHFVYSETCIAKCIQQYMLKGNQCRSKCCRSCFFAASLMFLSLWKQRSWPQRQKFGD